MVNIQSYIASFDGDNFSFLTKDQHGVLHFGDSVVSSDLPKRAVLALPGELFARRFHVRPFESKRALGKILPSSLENMLFAGQESCQNVHLTRSVEAHKFTSYSVDSDVLADYVNKSSDMISPILNAVPLPMGLSFYAKDDVATVVITPCDAGVMMACMNAEKTMVDFRVLSEKKWKSQAHLTLQTWLNFMDDAVILLSDLIKAPALLPKGIKERIEPLQVPNGIAPDQLAMYGLLQMSESKLDAPLSLPVKDKSTRVSLNNIFTKLNKALWVGVAAMLVAGVHWGYGSYNYNQEAFKIGVGIERAFDEALPNSPLIDAPLQMTRRVNELALLAGNSLVNVSPLGGQLVHLQEQLLEAEISMTLDEVSMSRENVRLRGQLASLSRVDELQNVMRSIFEGYKIELKSAQIGEAGKVDFHVEAIKERG